MEELDEVICLGEFRIAAIVKRSLHCGPPHSVAVYGTKRPVAILIRGNGATTAFEIDGSRISERELERRYPDQCVRFEKEAGDF